MARREAKKLTPEQKERLKDPKVVVALRAIRPLIQAKRQRRRLDSQ